MRLLAAMVRYELALQRRSSRFRIAAIGYVGLCSVPAGLMYFIIRHHSEETIGASSYLAQTLEVQPYLTALLVVMIAGNRSSTAALTELWSVLSSAPISNTGFVVRRWLALLSLIVPLTIVPQIFAFGAALAAGQTHFDAVTWVGSWSLQVLPLTVAVSAYWFAFVTITGGELAALITTFAALPMVVSVANQILMHYHLTLAGHSRWFSYWNLFTWLRWTLANWGDTGRNDYAPSYTATAAPYDLAFATGWLYSGALICGAGALGLGLAVAFVRRTRRDLRPRPVPPEHQLRTFLTKLNRQRELYARDGGLGLRERLAMVMGVVMLGLFVGWWLHRQLHFHRLAVDRYQALIADDYAPLPLTIQPTTWNVRGEIDRRGGLELAVKAQFENRGTDPQNTLAFTLNPSYQIAEVHIESRQVSTQRAWDRLLLTVEPPLGAGEQLELTAELTGIPTRIRFYLGRWAGGPQFVADYEAMIHARFPRDIRDLSRTSVRRVVSERRIDLRAQDLSPLPRYTPWTLTQPGESAGSDRAPSDNGREVPLEAQSIPVDLDLDLTFPAKWLLADTCGHVSQVNGEQARLKGVCRTSLTDLQVAGGSMVLVEDEASPRPGDGGANQAPGVAVPDGPEAGRVIFAALPAHQEQARDHLRSLARVASLSDRAWPGLPGLDDLVVLEWPPEFFLDLRSGMRRQWGDSGADLNGQLLLMAERQLIATTPFEAEDLVAQLLNRDLLSRRELVPEQDLLFREFFRSLMIRRMGLDRGRGATVSGKPWIQQALKVPILDADSRKRYIWKLRLPAILAELESRIGGEHFYAGIESFLAAAGDQPGSIEELLAELEKRSGLSLQRTYQDHFKGSALPLLRLEDVHSVRHGSQWEVEGKLRNTGTGEANCPVIIKTEVSELRLMVTVDSETATTFKSRTGVRPHTVLLDPEETCYRFQFKTAPALERANLLD